MYVFFIKSGLKFFHETFEDYICNLTLFRKCSFCIFSVDLDYKCNMIQYNITKITGHMNLKKKSYQDNKNKDTNQNIFRIMKFFYLRTLAVVVGSVSCLLEQNLSVLFIKKDNISLPCLLGKGMKEERRNAKSIQMTQNKVDGQMF